jgi:AAA+ superfamily predicted ATPase
LPRELIGVGRLLEQAELLPAELELTSQQADSVARITETVARRFAPRCPLIYGEGGVGKTTLARAAAKQLLEHGVAQQVVEIAAASLCAGCVFPTERDERLRFALEAIVEWNQAVVIVEQFDLALARSHAAAALVANFLDRGLQLIAVTRPGFRPHRRSTDGQLRRRVELVMTRPPEDRELVTLLRRHVAVHPMAKQFDVPEQLYSLIVRASSHRTGANPGAALGVLDALISRAVLGDSPCIGPDDVFHLVPQKDKSRFR